VFNPADGSLVEAIATTPLRGSGNHRPGGVRAANVADGAELLRIMKPGRQLVRAETSFSAPFYARAQTHVHLEYWLRKLLEGTGQDFNSLLRCNQNELVTALAAQLDSIETLKWRGVELLWGRPPAETR
jgi:hypothetical protein